MDANHLYHCIISTSLIFIVAPGPGGDTCCNDHCLGLAVEVLDDWALPTVVQKGDKVDLR